MKNLIQIKIKMSQPEPIRVTIKLYGDEKFVELPLEYNIFIKSILTMLGIEQNLLETFQFSYQNSSDLKVYFIKNEDDYNLFLKACSENNTKILDVNLINEVEIQNENNQANEDKLEIKEISSNKNYKESFIEEEKEENDNNIKIYSEQNNNNLEIKKDSGNILNNIEENEGAMEFSLLGESNNIIEQNIINNNINEKINNKNSQKIIIKKSNDKNDIINNEAHNEIKVSSSLVKFNMKCNICKQNKGLDIVYYCKDCQIFFCDTCEVDIGKIHKHCYYKIRNNKQYKEINNKIQQSGNKFTNFNKDLNKSIINNGNFIENSVKGIISEGSKIFGNIGNSIKNFFNSNENDNNQNNNPNELNNPYAIRNNNLNQNQNNHRNIPNDNQLHILVAQAKSKYNLSEISDIDIERALVQHNGNIDDAASMLLMNKDL